MQPAPARLALTLVGLLCAAPGAPAAHASAAQGFSEKDGALYTDDAVIINAAVSRARRDADNSTRDGKQFIFFHTRQAEQEAFGLECETTVGKRGTCKSFRDCYPLFKVAQLSAWDGWVMGHYDTCSYISADNMEVFGVCCTEPVGTPPQQEPDVQRLGALPPAVPVPLPPLNFPSNIPTNLISALTRHWAENSGLRQIPAQWPPTMPPLPTHPPDHTAPTHPPSIAPHQMALKYINLEIDYTVSTQVKLRAVADITMTTKKPPASVTWTTKPPSTTKATTKQSWPPMYPTHPTMPSKPPMMPSKPPMMPSKPPTAPSQPVVDSSCGIKNGVRDQERIVGGQNAELNEWPWIVALFNGGRQFCGGSIIDDRHVLSAAHCVAHMTSWDVARLTARLGDHNIRINTETQHVERKIKRVVRHRGFDMRTLYNDVSLLTLDQPVKFSKTIRPICLPGGSRAYSGLIGTVIGWGSLRENGAQPAVLQKVSIPIWSNQDCRLKYGAAAPGGIVDHMMCAGRATMDSCSGDSGGPLMVNEGGRWTQVGVVSWGIGCGKGQYPGVYTRVTAFLPWIQKNSK